ncbi:MULTISPECIES: SCO0930 family lipoprotein [Streptomyces]|uniref:SCO0930 family lipoprotein n=1 Tax=Streptomyces TaxID=1883 RepID=UPI0004C68567|nr:MULTISPECIES: SCO0930 family lipoprotein [unclassified Streptomyces]SEB65737.1 Predicted lipoprotein with conserved Yx(FWY)xxD motif [Streptomyces sp. KS_5]SED59966.1 Predicted lipoprotein with conserved Yx(FWY)xxD motif [Streptomyces sp. PAN_FS17]
MKTSWRSASLVVSAVAVAALTTACGSETAPPASSQNVGATAAAGDYGSGTGLGSGYDAGAAGQEGSATQAASAGELTVATNAELGELLTDSDGMTLYRFDKDVADPAKSNCDGDCATKWPPVPANDAKAGVGIDKNLLGSVTRTDGTKQLTIDGWPAYRYAKDTKAGDVNGQGVGGTWYALAPTGKKAEGEGAELPGLSTRKDSKLGEIVIDKNGHTVYRFMKDSPWPMKTACTGECLEKWPVIAPVEAEDTEGIDLKGSGPRGQGYVVFDRPDGIKQQTIDCVPIYTFAGDEKPGDTNGQGVGGTWFAIRPDGKPVGAPGQ